MKEVSKAEAREVADRGADDDDDADDDDGTKACVGPMTRLAITTRALHQEDMTGCNRRRTSFEAIQGG